MRIDEKNGGDMLNLHDVTLVIIDTRDHQLAKMAAMDCIKRCDFGDVLIFSDVNIGVPGACFVPIDPVNSLEEVATILWRDVPQYAVTSHMLVVQWDGWVTDAEMWSNDFMQFDYIGAPWWRGLFGVGNGGFSFRRVELMRRLTRDIDILPTMAEDAAICRALQPTLTREGFKFADFASAQQFSFECVRPSHTSRHFGFHGFRNWPFVLSEDELAERFALTKEHAYGEGRLQLKYFMHNWGKGDGELDPFLAVGDPPQPVYCAGQDL